MGQKQDDLIQKAELLLNTFGDVGAQKMALRAIEQELKSQGVSCSRLYQRIGRCCAGDASDPADFRCCYQPQEMQPFPSDEEFFELTH